jgi:CheY-like chemotaxis protein
VTSEAARPRVLLADDNSDMREYVRRLLAARFDVEAVADGCAALEAMRRCRFALVLADVMMPGLGGLDLLRALRADPRLRTVPVILLSALAETESRVEGLDAGGRAEISVRDTGVGMEPDQVDGMFEPFSQAEQGLARREGGLGLGLALAKGLVELHGGSIRGWSDGPGLGSEFAVSLPIAP